jgi:prepilin-type N-terminal cleavage/methylation domain-containing protein
MKRSQSGFTLIELVVVIVLLGILGVTALGKFQNLSGQAADASEQGIASELTSAAAINYASRLVGNTTTTTAITTADCEGATTGSPSTILNALMASGSAPTANLTYAISADGDITTEDAACAAGQTYTCTVTNSQGTAGAGTASIICIP